MGLQYDPRDALEVVDALISGGASLAVAMDNGHVRVGALSSAANACDLEMVRRLVEAGCDVNERAVSIDCPSEADATPLHQLLDVEKGCSAKYVEQIGVFLLQSRADPNAVTREGVTPLMRAAMHGHVKFARQLVKCPGIKLEAATFGVLSLTALDCAKGRLQVQNLPKERAQRIQQVADIIEWEIAELSGEQSEYYDTCAQCGARSGNLHMNEDCKLIGTRFAFCATCMAVRYCSKECQRQHWPVHKKNCKVLAVMGGSLVGTRDLQPPLHKPVAEMSSEERLAAVSVGLASGGWTPELVGSLATHGNPETLDLMAKVVSAFETGECSSFPYDVGMQALQLEAAGDLPAGSALEHAREQAASSERLSERHSERKRKNKKSDRLDLLDMLKWLTKFSKMNHSGSSEA